MNYHDITTDDMLNGDGLRVVLWVSGCDHYCQGCQNPLTWNPDDGLEFSTDAKAEIFAELAKSHISGITFSGGDPLHIRNIMTVYQLCVEIKRNFPHKTIWIYTGYKWEDISRLKVLLKYVDILVDGQFEADQKDMNYPWAGSRNQRVIDVQRSLKEGKVVLHECC